MAYTQSAAVGNVDSLMSIIRNSLSGSGMWKHFAMNTSSLHCNAGSMGREDIYRAEGLPGDPTRFYVSVHRHTQGNCCDDRVQFMACVGVKGFESPITIQSITKFSAASAGLIGVTCSVPHGFVTGDHVMVNGTPHSGAFHDGWGGGDGNPTTGGYVVLVNGTASFNYASQQPGAISYPAESISGSNLGYCMAVYNQVSTRNGSVNSGIGITLNDANMSLFMYYDEYRFCGLVSQGGSYQPFYVGETARDHIPQDFSSRAFLNVSASAGAITASVDRACNNIRVGQKIWFVHASGTNGTGSFERTTVTSKPTTTTFGCVLQNGYNSGSIIGEDPLPVCTVGNVGTITSTGQFTAKTARFIFHLDATRDPTNPGSAQTMTIVTDAGFTKTNIDPDGAGYYQGRDVYMQRSGAPTGIRGRLVGITSFPTDIQNDQDIMRTGADAVTDDYRYFISQLVESSYGMGIGPGAQ